MDHYFIGTAAWALPRTATGFFAASGSQLERYASRFRAVEIDSSFYRDHEAKTYQKWASMTPDSFRFPVKLSRRYTHDPLWNSDELQRTLDGVMHLDKKLAVLLIQLAPRHRFDLDRDEGLFRAVRRQYKGSIVCEPRHRSWASSEAHQLMQHLQITKVKADPERCPDLVPEHQSQLSYRRLHGSPEIYVSDYAYPTIQHLAENLRTDAAAGKDCWCIFDNTKFGRATHNALELSALLHDQPVASSVHSVLQSDSHTL